MVQAHWLTGEQAAGLKAEVAGHVQQRRIAARDGYQFNILPSGQAVDRDRRHQLSKQRQQLDQTGHALMRFLPTRPMAIKVGKQ